MNKHQLYEIMDMPDPNFPIKVVKYTIHKPEKMFVLHWHEHMELLYFTEGRAMVECSQNAFEVEPGDLVVVNSNELHQGDCITDRVSYYCIILDLSSTLGQMNYSSSKKYISQITKNLMLFSNKISSDSEIEQYILNLVRELEAHEEGYELAVVSSICQLLVLFIRKYTDKLLTETEYDLKAKNIERFNVIFKLVETNYADRITVSYCANLLNITVSHFCHLFKLITGKTLSGYINYIRIKKAEALLKNTDLNITEIALSVGFNDIPHFTKTFRSEKNMSPSEYRKQRFKT